MLKQLPLGQVPIACCRANDLYHRPIRGSRQFPCYNCGEDVKASPSSVQLQEAGGGQLVCLPCVVLYAQARGQKFTGIRVNKQEITDFRAEVRSN